MENQTDNAIVQEAAVENTTPNAEIKKKRGRKPKNTIPQEAKTVDAIEVVDEAADDEPSMDIEKERPEVHSAESSRDGGDEGAYGDNAETMQGYEANETADTTAGIEDKAETVESNANSNDTLGIADNADEAAQEDTARAEHTIDVAEAMRRIMMFTEEMKAEAETEKVNETDASKADDDNQNNTSLSNENLFEEERTAHEDDESLNTETEDVKEVDPTDNGATEADLIDNAVDGAEPTEREALANDDASDEAKSADTADKDVADAIAKETVNAGDTTDIENTEDGEEYDDFGIEDEFGSIPDSFYEDDIPYSDDDNSSISALLYDDDDERITSDFEKRTSISFSEIKEQMKRLKDEATELHTEETEEVSQEESTTEFEETADAEEVEEAVEEIPEITESPEEEMPTEEIPEEEPKISEKKSYIRDINKSETVEEDLTEGRGEHIITIDRARVKDKEIPEGRLIDTVFEAVELFTFAVLIIMLLLSFVFRHTTVSGPSMLPTFNDGDRLIISNLFYEPKRGDVVVFDDRTNEAYDDMPIIKRIIGLEGDVVKIEDGIIMVKENGEDEFKIVNYVEDMEIPYRDMEEVTVGKGEMFVMGDNVNNSLDSTDRNENDPTRNVGNIKTDSILGKVILRFYVVKTVFSEETQEWVTKGRIVFDTKFTLE